MHRPPNLPFFCHNTRTVKENLHHNEGANSQMFTQKVRFNYSKNLRIRTWIFQLASKQALI